MNDELRFPFWIEVGLGDAIPFISYQQLPVCGVFFGIQYEPGIDNTTREREYVEGSVYQVVPLAGYI